MTEIRRSSREEQRQRTRRDLIDAARVVFARQGYHATSVDQIAEAAGYTKGAVYSNFSSKEELFLELFQSHLEQAVDTIAEIVEHDEPTERARLVSERRDKMVVFQRDWYLLEAEFALYAARRPEVRERMAARQRDNAARIGALVAQHLADVGADADDATVEDITRLLIAAGDGLTQMSLTQPEVESGRLLGLLVRLMERATVD